jgi:CheY-like chemotaxis protein
VLVVDDEFDARDAITAVLEECGAEVIAVSSVAEAIGSIPRARPAVIVSDIAMPAEDGFALIRGVKELGAERGGTVPVLALTAYASAGDEERILEAGYRAYLTKPVEARELVAAVAGLAHLRRD